MAIDRAALSGIRVLELGSFVAGPFCGRLLADFGAEVIKVEQPDGDQVRSMGHRKKGVSLFAASIMRNKKLISIDLKTEKGRDLVKQLIGEVDVVIENFRPGVLDNWGLGYENLRALNPAIIMVRISGFGQEGPYRDRPGFGVIGEAISGLREMIGDPDRPPARVAVPLTDYLAGLFAAFGTLAAVVHRSQTGEGQCIDAALYEAAFSMLEAEVPAYAALGLVAKRAGSMLPGHSPSNLYETRDRRHIHISGGSQSIFQRLLTVMGREELFSDPRFATGAARSENAEVLDRIVADWVSGLDLEPLEQALHEARVPAAPIKILPDIFEDPHFAARAMLATVEHGQLGSVTLAGVVPKLSATPGDIRTAGGVLGRDTEDVLKSYCNLTERSLAQLLEEGVIRSAARVPEHQ